MRSILRFLPLLALAGIASSQPAIRPVLGSTPSLRAERVPLDPRHPGLRRLGALTYLGGIRLTSEDPAFGGFSSMTVDGDRFTLLSDAGNVLRFRMGPDLSPFDPRFGDLPAGPGTGWFKSERDSESMTRDPATGRVWVGFENANAIWRFDGELAKATGSVQPPVMADWPVNGGPESMVRLADGGFIVLAETDRPHGTTRGRVGVRFLRDPVDAPRHGFTFVYMPPDGYDPSDMAVLPDGRLLVLDRMLSLPALFTAKLVLIDPAEIRPGAVVKGREIASFVPPLTRDNFEALAVTREGAATILWIASDDNLQPPQRSLLLKFRLDRPAAPTP